MSYMPVWAKRNIENERRRNLGKWIAEKKEQAPVTVKMVANEMVRLDPVMEETALTPVVKEVIKVRSSVEELLDKYEGLMKIHKEYIKEEIHLEKINELEQRDRTVKLVIFWMVTVNIAYHIGLHVGRFYH